MDKIKRHPYLFAATIVSLLIGIWLICSDHNRIISTVYFLVGGGLILTGLYKMLLLDYRENKTYLYDGILNIIIGMLIMFVHNFIATLILGLVFAALPVVRIVKSDDPKSALKKEFPLLIIGLVIAFSGDLLANVFIKLIGILFILLAVYLIVSIFTEKIIVVKLKNKRSKHNQERDNVIDVDYEERD